MPLVRRLPALDSNELDDAQRELWDTVIPIARNRPTVDADQHLLGPYDPLLRSPEVGIRVAALGVDLRKVTKVPRRWQVLSILATGAHWHCDFTWNSWINHAKDEGIEEEPLIKLRDGLTPVFNNSDDQLICTFSTQLLGTGNIEETIFRATQQLIGDAGVVELIVLIGYYGVISFLLNGFQIPIPEGEPYVWV